LSFKVVTTLILIIVYSEPFVEEVGDNGYRCQSLAARVMGMLEILKEFLESSTIHGLAHISTAKVRDRL
jgi:hypothetical protein